MSRLAAFFTKLILKSAGKDLLRRGIFLTARNMHLAYECDNYAIVKMKTKMRFLEFRFKLIGFVGTGKVSKYSDHHTKSLLT